MADSIVLLPPALSPGQPAMITAWWHRGVKVSLGFPSVLERVA